MSSDQHKHYFSSDIGSIPNMQKYQQNHNARPSAPYVTEFLQNLEKHQQKVREKIPNFVFLVDFPGLKSATNTQLEHWLSYVNDHISNYAHGLVQLVIDEGMSPIIAPPAREIVKKGGIKGLYVEVVDESSAEMKYLPSEGFFVVQELKNNPYNGVSNFYTEIRRHLVAPPGTLVRGIDLSGLTLSHIYDAVSLDSLDQALNSFGGKVEVDMESIRKQADAVGLSKEDPDYWFGYIWRDGIVGVISDLAHAKNNYEGAAQKIRSLSIKGVPPFGDKKNDMELKGNHVSYSFDLTSKYEVKNNNIYYWVRDTMEKVNMSEPIVAENMQEMISLHPVIFCFRSVEIC